MPIAVIYGFIVAALPLIVRKLMVLLGVSVVYYVGVDILFEQVESAVMNQLSAIPTEVISIAAIGGFGVVIKMHLAAISAVVTYKLTVGLFKRITIGGS